MSLINKLRLASFVFVVVRFVFGFHESSAVLERVQHQSEAGIALTAAESSVAFAARVADPSPAGASDGYYCTLSGKTALLVDLGGGTCFAAHLQVLACYLARLDVPNCFRYPIVVVVVPQLVSPSLLVVLPILPIQPPHHSNCALTLTTGLQQD